MIFNNKKRVKKVFYSLLLFGLILFMTGCKTKVVESIVLDKEEIVLELNGLATVVATVYPGDAEFDQIDWSSSDDNVAIVSGGDIIAVGYGTASITASIGTVKDSVTIIVLNPLELKEIIVDKKQVTIEVEESIKLTATLNPKNAVETISWGSSDNSIATVTNGLVTGVKPGKVTITVNAGKFSDTAEITVTEKNLTVTYVFNGGNLTYTSRLEMVEEFINDYNIWGNTNYTLESFPMGAWTNVDIHVFLLDEQYNSKWAWIASYLGEVGSNTNKKACADLAKATSVKQYEGFNSNHKYALSYEVRGFIKGVKFTSNANWISSDYSDYQLANGFWADFTVSTGQNTNRFLGESILPVEVYRGGYTFLGWYDNALFAGNPITKVNQTTNVYAKWEILKPITEMKFNDPITSMIVGEEYQSVIEFTPTDAYDKTIIFKTSDDKVLSIGVNGLIKALNPGIATITVTASLTKVTTSITIEVLPLDDIEVSFSEGFNGVLNIEEETSLTINGIGVLKDSNFRFRSKTPEVISVTNEGVIKALSLGDGVIEVLVNEGVILTVNITVTKKLDEDRIEELLSLLTKSNFAVVDALNATIFYDPSSNQRYIQSKYGSVNLFLFDDINYDTSKDWTVKKTNALLDSVEFITIHDTANINSGLIGHGDFFISNDGVSIHYVVGDNGVISSTDDRYVGWHAGDGTSTKFTWMNTGIASNGKNDPIIDISSTGYFTFNGVASSVQAPRGFGGAILDKSYFSNNGPQWKIGEDGDYYLGNSYFSTSQNSRGVISSYGGNRNSIGIEMCVNTNGDIYDTWQRTAKLVASLLVINNLDITRVLQHNDFSGKHCPASLIATNYWDTFIKMVEIEYIIQTEFMDAEITLISNNPEVMDNTGRVISNLETTTSVTYTLNVKIGEVTKSVNLGSVIPGTNSFLKLDGMYAINN